MFSFQIFAEHIPPTWEPFFASACLRRSRQRQWNAQGGHGAGHALHEQRPLCRRGLQGGAAETRNSTEFAKGGTGRS